MNEAQKERIKNYYGNKCVICNGTDNLVIHHKSYENNGHEKDDELSLLCKRCHSLFHKRTQVKKPRISTDGLNYITFAEKDFLKLEPMTIDEKDIIKLEI